MLPVTKEHSLEYYLNSTEDKSERSMYIARYNLLGLRNRDGVVVKAEDPDVQSSNSYDTELTFDSGLCGVRWLSHDTKKMNYYQSDDYNLV